MENNMKAEFRKQWALAVNNKENHPYKDKMHGTKYQGKVYGVHYVVYNIARGLPIERGFIKGSESLEAHIRTISMYLRMDKLHPLLFPFNNTLTAETFKEMADEALRIYSSS